VVRCSGAPDEGFDELAANGAAHLVRYKWPTRIARVDALPKTSVNPIDKKALRLSSPSLGATHGAAATLQSLSERR
jgi:hypothetical protein